MSRELSKYVNITCKISHAQSCTYIHVYAADHIVVVRLLTLSIHTQLRLRYLVCVCMCVSISLSDAHFSDTMSLHIEGRGYQRFQQNTVQIIDFAVRRCFHKVMALFAYHKTSYSANAATTCRRPSALLAV